MIFVFVFAQKKRNINGHQVLGLNEERFHVKEVCITITSKHYFSAFFMQGQNFITCRSLSERLVMQSELPTDFCRTLTAQWTCFLVSYKNIGLGLIHFQSKMENTKRFDTNCSFGLHWCSFHSIGVFLCGFLRLEKSIP